MSQHFVCLTYDFDDASAVIARDMTSQAADRDRHMGGLPFFMQRVDVMPVELTQLKRPTSAYLHDNLHYTFAGFNFPRTFLDLLLDIWVSRIMFWADYPYGSMIKARAFLEQIPGSAADRAWIAHGNAESFFRLSASTP
jgi:uncharacterized protein